jgi:ribosomal protein S12 methylthiotransferase accessory factor
LGDGSRWPAVTLGLGAGNDRRQAVTRAVLEHGQTGPFLADQWRGRKCPIPATHSDIRTLHDQALYYCDPAHRAEFDSWRSGAPSAIGDSAGKGADVQNEDVRIAIVDLTPPELLDSPYCVVRAVARGLQPVHAGFGLERTYTKRLERLLRGREPNPAPPPIC